MGLLSTLWSRRKKASDGAVDPALLEPGGESAVIETANALVDEGKRELALELLRRAQQTFPGDTEIAERAEQLERSLAMQALADAEERYSAQPSNPDVCVDLSDLYRRLGDSQKALKYGREAIERNNTTPSGYRSVGRIYLDRFRDEENSVDGINALRYLTKAHTLAPKSSLGLIQLAEVFVILRAPQAARRFLDPVQRAFGDDPTVAALFARLDGLEAETTTHVPELFLRFERMRGDEGFGGGGSLDIDEDTLQTFLDSALALDSAVECWVVDADGGHVRDTANNERDTAPLTAFAHMLQQHPNRMGLGDFTGIVLRDPAFTLVCAPAGIGVAGICGTSELRVDEAKACLDTLGKSMSKKAVQSS